MRDEKRYVTAGVCAQAKYDEPQMATAMDNSMHTLAEALSELDATVAVLIGRCKPVLIPTPTESTKEADGLKYCASELRSRIDDETNRVYKIIDDVSAAINRLEI